MVRRKPAVYGKYVLTISLRDQDSIGPSRFSAAPGNYMQQLRGRATMPNGLRALLAELFRRQVITGCDITHGTMLQLNISQHKPSGGGGRRLLLNGALQQFLAVFEELTATKLQVNWRAQGSGPLHSWRQPDTDRVITDLADVLDLVCDGLIMPASNKKLSRDD